jgi:plastocyanin
MAARHLPITAAVCTIAIDNTFTPTPQGVVVQPGDQVEFQNNSGVDIIIEFAANPPGQAVYSNMNLPVTNGTTAGFTAPNYSASANYSVYQGTTEESGPWVVQVGTGPMFVQLSDASGVVNYAPPTVAIPHGNATTGKGQLVIMPSLNSGDYTIKWGVTDPVTPPLGASGTSSHAVTSAPGEYDYSATADDPCATVPKSDGSGGGGTIIVRSS